MMQSLMLSQVLVSLKVMLTKLLPSSHHSVTIPHQKKVQSQKMMEKRVKNNNENLESRLSVNEIGYYLIMVKFGYFKNLKI